MLTSNPVIRLNNFFKESLFFNLHVGNIYVILGAYQLLIFLQRFLGNLPKYEIIVFLFNRNELVLKLTVNLIRIVCLAGLLYFASGVDPRFQLFDEEQVQISIANLDSASNDLCSLLQLLTEAQAATDPAL